MHRSSLLLRTTSRIPDMLCLAPCASHQVQRPEMRTAFVIVAIRGGRVGLLPGSAKGAQHHNWSKAVATVLPEIRCGIVATGRNPATTQAHSPASWQRIVLRRIRALQALPASFKSACIYGGPYCKKKPIRMTVRCYGCLSHMRRDDERSHCARLAWISCAGKRCTHCLGKSLSFFVPCWRKQRVHSQTLREKPGTEGLSRVTMSLCQNKLQHGCLGGVHWTREENEWKDDCSDYKDSAERCVMPVVMICTILWSMRKSSTMENQTGKSVVVFMKSETTTPPMAPLNISLPFCWINLSTRKMAMETRWKHSSGANAAADKSRQTVQVRQLLKHAHRSRGYSPLSKGTQRCGAAARAQAMDGST